MTNLTAEEREATLLVPLEGDVPAEVTEAVAAALAAAGRRVVRLEAQDPHACREAECLATLARRLSLGRVVTGRFGPAGSEGMVLLSLIELDGAVARILGRALRVGPTGDAASWARATAEALFASAATAPPGAATGAEGAPVAFDLRGQPEGATVFIDGVELSAGQPVPPLGPGPHLISAATAAVLHQAIVGPAATGSAPDVVVPLTVQLQPLGMATLPLRVESHPGGAEVRLDGVLLGVTPLSAEVTPRAGAQLTLTLSGHRELTHEVDLGLLAWERRGRMTFGHRAELLALPVPVQFDGVPEGARIVLDGSRVLSPQTEIEPGAHEVRIVTPGYEEFVRRIELSPGKSARYEVALKPSAAYVSYVEDAAFHRRAFIASGLCATVLGAGAGVAFFFGLNETESAYSAHADYLRATDPDEIEALYAEVGRHRQNAEIGQGIGISVASAAAVALGLTLYWRFAHPDDPREGSDLGFTPAPSGLLWRW